MPEVGRCNTLTITRITSAGALLDGGPLGEIFISRRQLTQEPETGTTLDVFLFPDADGSIAASTTLPRAELGQVALLRVADVNDTGAFLDWGLEKDLLLPYAEHVGTLKAGQSVLVMIYQDPRGRLVASMKLDEFIDDIGPEMPAGTPVTVIVGNKTELGYKAVIDHRRWGLLYDSDLLKPLRRGDTVQAYVKKTRPDQRIDLTLTPPKRIAVPDLSQQILAMLDDNDGFLALGDKSPPEVIYRLFGQSKKAFKQAIGRLYKQGEIAIESGGIRRKLR
ncbi:S1-like domain-containing RNA-binding protein [Spongiibacter taiwanensis]|uniref:CvfB family protein n=1 Tax=Spongiibacter taiwanensis TaxID=1748242 RepID=UPI002035A4C9|nr:S1-like domain-containing RNA-binding protein [Spongiibacter taiwanensis]USA42891.1 S1-like domain-containing RNA-binding protein [Spongiibacter taiwanensis]